MEEVAQGMPPRATGARTYHSNAAVARIKAETGCCHPEAVRIAAAEWNQLPEEAKAPWLQLGAADKARAAEQRR
jgi:hypothetical protein